MKDILFFCLENDLKSLMDDISRYESFTLFKAGLANVNLKDINDFYIPLKDIPSLGYVTGDQPLNCETYLIMPIASKLKIEVDELEDGMVQVFSSMANNDNSIKFQPSGYFSNEIIICGKITTDYNTPFTRRILKRFIHSLKKKCNKVNGYYLSPSCLSAYKEGVRLIVASIHAPKEYDFVIPIDNY